VKAFAWMSLCLLAACSAPEEDSGSLSSYTVRGRIKFKNTNPAVTDAQFGGPIHVVLFNTDNEGYCLTGPAAFAAVKFGAIEQGDITALKSDGMTFEFSVPEAPGQTYPLTIYPSAVWQNTLAITHACETDAAGGLAKWNAGGFYGIDYAAGNNSVCCSYHSAPLVVSERGAIVDGIEIEMIPQVPTKGSCYDPSEPYNACELRYAPPPNQTADSACWTALGDQASSLIKLPKNAGACP
jgi:hypothetical protein